jgi:glycosyltransferase involved in cell wall biosynthesis
MPLVSVVVPAYNAAAHLAETLDSVLAQTHRELDVIVVDDGSTDATPRVAARYPHVRYVRQDNRGVSAARNHGFRLARGEYVAFLDADDVWSPHMIAAQLDIFRRYPESGFVAADGIQFDDRGTVGSTLLWGEAAGAVRKSSTGVASGRFHHAAINNNPITTVGQVLLPRRVLEAVGLFRERPNESEDWDLWLRIVARYPVTFHSASLMRYRRTEVSASGPALLRHIRWALRGAPVIRRHLRSSPPEARTLLRDKMKRAIGEAAREAYYLGRRVDVELGRRALARLWRAKPGSLRTALYLLALYLPEQGVSRVAQAMRSVTSAMH